MMIDQFKADPVTGIPCDLLMASLLIVNPCRILNIHI